MNTQHIAFIGAAMVLLILGIGIGRLSSSPHVPATESLAPVATSTEVATSTPSPTATAPTAPTKKPVPATTVAPVKEVQKIFANAGTKQCTYEHVSGTTRSTNRLYIGNGKARGEFRSTTAEGAVNTIMVFDGNALYTWTEGMGSGQKTSIRSVADVGMLVPKGTGGVVLGEAMDGVSWVCSPWILDASKLAVPSYVQF